VCQEIHADSGEAEVEEMNERKDPLWFKDKVKNRIGVEEGGALQVGEKGGSAKGVGVPERKVSFGDQAF